MGNSEPGHGDKREAGGLVLAIAETKFAMASVVACGWSRCGEWRHVSSIASVQGTLAWLAIESHCARVPYSSSLPWITRIGTAIFGTKSSIFQARKAGLSQISFQPQNVCVASR